MATNERTPQGLPPLGTIPAPIHPFFDGTPLRLCVLARTEEAASNGPFVLLREIPGARVYLGAICDAQARIQELVEVWVQTLDLRDLTFSGYQERLTNFALDQRWRLDYAVSLEAVPERVIVTGMEEENPGPVLIKKPSGDGATRFAASIISGWRVCKDDALLDSFGLPPYSTSPYRYLHLPGAPEPKTFVATSDDAPANAHVQPLQHLKTEPGFDDILNPHAGCIRVLRLNPLALEDYLQLLEGRPWTGVAPGGIPLPPATVYSELATWSNRRKGTSFLLHATGARADQRNEIFFLKISALLGMCREVRTYVKAHQLPLLNLSPSSFTLNIRQTGPQFPSLWTSACQLTTPGQAFPLRIKSTEQRYFIRLGRVGPSPFLPEGLGAHSFGIGSVRLRNVLTEGDGVVLEGTLVAEDYLGLDPHDLLWFKLPLGEEKLEFYAHVYTSEAVGPREARFRTVPARLPEPVVATLKRSLISFSKAPYEVWPLLSSPCDLHSLGILGTRVLLANSDTNFPVLLDDILGLARHLGKDPAGHDTLQEKLKAVLRQEPRLTELVSPRALMGPETAAEAAWSEIHKELWLDALAVVLRMFPGAGCYSFCKSFGDVSPLALETVFDQPIEQLEQIALRLRSVLVPTLFANEELARVVLGQLTGS